MSKELAPVAPPDRRTTTLIRSCSLNLGKTSSREALRPPTVKAKSAEVRISVVCIARLSLPSDVPRQYRIPPLPLYPRLLFYVQPLYCRARGEPADEQTADYHALPPLTPDEYGDRHTSVGKARQNFNDRSGCIACGFAFLLSIPTDDDPRW